MSDPTQTSGRPEAGLNRSTALFVAWLFIGGSLLGLAILEGVSDGFGDAWLFLLGSLFLFGFVVRDWFFRGGGKFTTSDDAVFLSMTVLTLLGVVWILTERFVL